MVKFFFKPEYFFRPSNLLRRIRHAFFPRRGEMQKIKLCWGPSITANPRQTIGHSLDTFGLYDLPLSELIFRLVEPGDTVLDAGANVGYMSRLMMDRLGGTGTLYSFEPIPELFKILEKNTAPNGLNAKLFNLALSDRAGKASLTLPEAYSQNDGVATLSPDAKGLKIEVKLTTIDSLNLERRVKLLKIDVEGHELPLLRGAEKTIDRNGFEHIIFEDLCGYPTPVSEFLESKGYTILKLIKGFTGLRLEDPRMINRYSFEPDNFLATKSTEIRATINRKSEWRILQWKRSVR